MREVIEALLAENEVLTDRKEAQAERLRRLEHLVRELQRVAKLTCQASFMVHRVGVGVCSSRRCMKTFEAPSRKREANDGPKNANPGTAPESRSSISSKSSSERGCLASRRWRSRTSRSRSSRIGSPPCSFDSPTL